MVSERPKRKRSPLRGARTIGTTPSPTPAELVAPSRQARLEGLNPATNPYLRSAADMAALGFTGEPYTV